MGMARGWLCGLSRFFQWPWPQEFRFFLLENMDMRGSRRSYSTLFHEKEDEGVENCTEHLSRSGSRYCHRFVFLIGLARGGRVSV